MKNPPTKSTQVKFTRYKDPESWEINDQIFLTSVTDCSKSEGIGIVVYIPINHHYRCNENQKGDNHQNEVKRQ